MNNLGCYCDEEQSGYKRITCLGKIARLAIVGQDGKCVVVLGLHLQWSDVICAARRYVCGN
jgi:hypothetical protein